jgi:hypothetical protein
MGSTNSKGIVNESYSQENWFNLDKICTNNFNVGQN